MSPGTDITFGLSTIPPASRHRSDITFGPEAAAPSEGDIKMADSKRIPVTLTGDQHSRLITVARRLHTSAAELIREAVDSALPVFEKEARQADAQSQHKEEELKSNTT